MAKLWKNAKIEPRATLPMYDCHTEAKEDATTPAGPNPIKASTVCATKRTPKVKNPIVFSRSYSGDGMKA